MQRRFTCNTTPSDFIQKLRHEGERIFWEQYHASKQWRTDSLRYYYIENIPQVHNNRYGGFVIEYPIRSQENHPDLEEYTDAQGNKFSADPTGKHERSTTFEVQPVGDRIEIDAKCGHEAGQEHFNRLLTLIGELYPESGLITSLDAERNTTKQASTFAKEKRGPKVGTLNRVREAHRLMTKMRWSLREACKKAHTHPNTYYQYCKEATGEDPIEAYQ